MRKYGQERIDENNKVYLRVSLSQYVRRFTGFHFGNWSKIHDRANQISHVTATNHCE